MNLSIFPPISSSSRYPSKPIAAPPKVGFKGIGDRASSVMEAIDKNRLIELTISDGLGMVVPRAMLAWSIRGPDDGRETFLRELTGLVCNVALLGLASHLVMSMMGKHVNFYNPQGILANAWINAGHLETFSHLYEQSLNQAHNSSEARQLFIQSVLKGLESDDRRFSIENRIANLRELSTLSNSQAKAQTDMLQQMLKTVYGESLTTAIKDEFHTLLKQGDFKGLQSRFLEAGWGRLSPDARKELADCFQINLKTTGLGISPLDESAWKALQEKGIQGKEKREAFYKTRLKLSIADQKNHEAAFMKDIERVALHHGLTSVVHLKESPSFSTGKALPATLLPHQDRQGLLKALKHFLEQVVDRVTFEVSHPLEGSVLNGKTALPGHNSSWIRQRRAIRERMFASDAKGWRQYFPQRSEGLVTAIMKSKGAYTWLPMGVTLGLAGVFTFYNNYYTQKKYGGKVFFPGEMSSARLRDQESEWEWA